MADKNITLALTFRVKWWWRLMLPVWIFQVKVLRTKPTVPRALIEVVKHG